MWSQSDIVKRIQRDAYRRAHQPRQKSDARALLLVIALFAIVLLVVTTTNAQDDTTPEPDCTTAQLTAAENRLMPVIQTLDEADDPHAVLLALEAAIDALRAACYTSAFTSEQHGNDAVFGPVAFGGTMYRATFTTQTFGSLELTAIEGDCDRFASSVFITDVDGATDQTLYEFEDCVAMIEVNTTSPWMLEFERLR